VNVSLLFRQGKETNSSTIIYTIANSIKNSGSYVYKIPGSTPAANDYLFEIIVGTVANISQVGANYSYSPSFVLHNNGTTNTTTNGTHHNGATDSVSPIGSSTPSPVSAEPGPGQLNAVGVIAGICIGALAVAGAIGGFLYWRFRRRSAQRQERRQNNIKLAEIPVEEETYSANLGTDIRWSNIPSGALRPMDDQK
jgi:Ser-Thr-rich glycosyl-phosphatidyl-inositol-anchored membrane family